MLARKRVRELAALVNTLESEAEAVRRRVAELGPGHSGYLRFEALGQVAGNIVSELAAMHPRTDSELDSLTLRLVAFDKTLAGLKDGGPSNGTATLEDAQLRRGIEAQVDPATSAGAAPSFAVSQRGVQTPEAADHRYEPLATDGSYRGYPLRDWQKAALGAWEDNGSRGVIEAITGTGKSLVGIAAIRQVVAEGGVALVLVPTSGLLQQWAKTARMMLPLVRVGLLTSGYKDTFDKCDLLVATVQSAFKKPPIPRSLGLLVADEVHRYGSAEFSRALHHSYERRLGLSGTYERQQDNGVETTLTPYFDRIVHSYGYKDALADGVVSPFHLALVATEFNSREQLEYDRANRQASDARTTLTRHLGYSADWREFFLEVQATLKRNAYDRETQLCSSYLEAFSTRRTVMAEASAKEEFVAHIAGAFGALSGTLVFTETMFGATQLARRIGRETSAFALTSESKSQERESKLREFGQGRIKVLCAPRILDEGIDVPEAELAVIVAASKSRRQMVQRMGRVIRLKADGRAARIVLTYVKGTSEDPELGGHEAFLEQILPHAASTGYFNGRDPDPVALWLGTGPSATAVR